MFFQNVLGKVSVDFCFSKNQDPPDDSIVKIISNH